MLRKWHYPTEVPGVRGLCFYFFEFYWAEETTFVNCAYFNSFTVSDHFHSQHVPVKSSKLLS